MGLGAPINPNINTAYASEQRQNLPENPVYHKDVLVLEENRDSLIMASPLEDSLPVKPDHQEDKPTEPIGPLLPEMIGGTLATKAEVPYLVNVGGCSGTLIDPQWIITGAHCNQRVPWLAWSDIYREGKGYTATTTAVYTLTVPPTNWWPRSVKLVHIDRPFPDSTPIAIYGGGSLLHDGAVVKQCGFGLTVENGPFPVGPYCGLMTASGVKTIGPNTIGAQFNMLNTHGAYGFHGDSGSTSVIYHPTLGITVALSVLDSGDSSYNVVEDLRSPDIIKFIREHVPGAKIVYDTYFPSIQNSQNLPRQSEPGLNREEIRNNYRYRGPGNTSFRRGRSA